MQPEYETFGRNAGAVAGSVDVALQQQKVLRNTYLMLALTMIPTVIGAYVGMATSAIVFQHPMAASLVILAAIIGLQFAIVANRNSAMGIGLLLLMTLLLGWWLGPLLSIALRLANGAQLVGYAAAGTGVVFAVMAGIATTTKRDFSFMGKFLFVGMIVLLIASFANMFLHIPVLALTVSSLAIVVFSLFPLHDLSRVITGGETNYVIATTQVYLDLYNIFVNLLSILISLSGDRR